MHMFMVPWGHLALRLLVEKETKLKHYHQIRENFAFSIQATDILLDDKHARSKYLLEDKCLVNVKEWKPYVLVIPLGKQKLGKHRHWAWEPSKPRGWRKRIFTTRDSRNRSAHTQSQKDTPAFCSVLFFGPSAGRGGKYFHLFSMSGQSSNSSLY